MASASLLIEYSLCSKVKGLVIFNCQKNVMTLTTISLILRQHINYEKNIQRNF